MFMEVRVFRNGIDTIRFNLDDTFQSPIFDSMFRGFSLNSNQKFGVQFMGHEFSVLSRIQSNMQTLYFEYAGDSVFCISKMLDGGIVRGISHVVTFYGALFYIPDLDQFLSGFISHYLPRLSLSRLDLYLDVNIPVGALWKHHVTQFQKKYRIEKSGKLETFYLGSKSNNKKHFIRVYDKKLDSQKKGKFHLFFEYLKEEIVTRIEVQLHVKSLQTMQITPAVILDYENRRLAHSLEAEHRLHSVFASCCIKKSGTLFPQLRSLDLAKVENIQTATYTGRVEDMALLDQVPYLKDFKTRAERIRQMHIDPLAFLQRSLPPPVISSNQPPSTVTSS